MHVADAKRALLNDRKPMEMKKQSVTTTRMTYNVEYIFNIRLESGVARFYTKNHDNFTAKKRK